MIAAIKKFFGKAPPPVKSGRRLLFLTGPCAGAGLCNHCDLPIELGEKIFLSYFNTESRPANGDWCCSSSCAAENAKLKDEGVV